jgi:hypothetical protein
LRATPTGSFFPLIYVKAITVLFLATENSVVLCGLYLD